MKFQWYFAMGALCIVGNSLSLIFKKIDGVESSADIAHFILILVGVALVGLKEASE